MGKKTVVVVGGGWAGCGASIAAAKAGARVVMLERTDLLLGTGLAGGLFRNNGRYTAAEELIAMGAGELFECMDATVTNGCRNVEMPHHRHGSMYNVYEIEPLCKKAVLEAGVMILMEHRFTELIIEGNRLKAVKCADGQVIEGDAFVDCTGSAGSMNNCARHGNGCCLCILRCPTFGSRVSLAEKAGIHEKSVKRPDGKRGAISGSCFIPKETVSPELKTKLEESSVMCIPLPEDLVKPEKNVIKACRQYSQHEFADNLYVLDNGYFKMVAPFIPLEELRMIPGLEKARFEDPYSGGKGNSVRYLAMAEVKNTLQAGGVANLFCGGEKAGTYVGHTEAVCTGTLAGHNAARVACGLDPIELPVEETVLGGTINLSNRIMAEEGEDLAERLTFSGASIFEWMVQKGLYTTDRQSIRERVDRLGLTNYFSTALE